MVRREGNPQDLEAFDLRGVTVKRLILLMMALTLLLAACAGGKPKGDEPPPAARHIVFTGPTAVDQATGLVWMTNANMPGKPLPWKADENVYAFIQGLNRDNFAGYSDWRLPTREELAGLVEYAKSHGYEPTRMESWPYQQLRRLGFRDVRDYGYWSATRNQADSREIWVADLASGRLMPRPETEVFCVWPVRGGR